LSKREREALRLISEQGSLPLDLLAHLLRCSLSTTKTLVSKLDQGGVRLSGTSLSFVAQRPMTFSGLRALNEVRLHVEARSPKARWTSRRHLRKICGGPGGRVPGAIVELNGERHAINIRLNEYGVKELVSRIDKDNAVYDAVVYFCVDPKVRRQLESLQAKYRWPKLVIWDLPHPA
jgi:hypothetical protein